MTDILDYNLDSLTPSVFDSRQSIIAPLPGEQVVTEVDTTGNYLDIITLISLLTSSKAIDYQLITDFFLTYRSFISQDSLLKLLILRLKWCLQYIDDDSHELKQNIGKLTLVRTFVVIRHWLLNYFTDDFISSKPLRLSFITEINALHHEELFVQRVISNLKKNWITCCNQCWEEDVRPDNYYTFTLKIGPQLFNNKNLSVFALNNRDDPLTRNSVMLSLYDEKTVHNLPIPPLKSGNRRGPRLPLNPKNSIMRLSIMGDTESVTKSSPPSSRDKLYVPLNVSLKQEKTVLDGHTKFPQDASISKVIPPTPVKKMELQIALPPPNKPQPTGLRSLIDSWIKTFSFRGNNSSNSVVKPQAEKFMASVVSVAKTNNKDLNKLVEGKFDILSARTIDELDYLVNYHNRLMDESDLRGDIIDADFTFDTSSVKEKISNIDNLNIYKTISNISRTVLTLQKHQRDVISGNSIQSIHSDVIPEVKDKFSFESYSIKGNENDRFEFENDQEGAKERFGLEEQELSIGTVLSESTPQLDDQNEDVEQHPKHTLSCAIEKEGSRNLSIVRPKSDGALVMKPKSNSTLRKYHSDQIDNIIKELLEFDFNLEESDDKVEEKDWASEVESFVSTYENIDVGEESDQAPGSLEQNSSEFVDDEPSTPPSSQVGLISSTPQISPIKSLHENHSDFKSSSSFQFEHAQSNDVNLNRIPSFTKISDCSISSVPHDDHLSYLSKRSARTQESTNSIFSSKANLLNVTVKTTANPHHQESYTSLNKEYEKCNQVSVDFVDSSVDSGDVDAVFAMNGVDSNVMAELAAISDDSYNDDPVRTTLMKLEGAYTKKKNHSSPLSTPIKTQKKENLDSITQKRRTRLYSFTPVKKKQVDYTSSSSKILLDLLLCHKITSDILQVQNAEQHACFILNYDSKTIAEQLTLIEKDTLLQIDWKELVDLTWESEKLQPTNSWLALLVQNEDLEGVDLCSSRFNLTVNWIISEILLTKNIFIQKLTIQRFIHIAQHCKAIQNFSTLMQIVLALVSAKVMSLKDTWRMIEPGDILIFKSLEALCSPSKNFMSLRLILNNIKPSLGCVPFIGLYLSDLYFNNKEKRSTKGNMINFGKFRMTAKIVCSLIQSIHWSMLYELKCDEEVLSKCLYIKALSEDEMAECVTQTD